MEVQKIILCVNDNAEYVSFWPVVYKAWIDKTGVEPHLFYVGGENNPTHNWLKSQTGEDTVTQLDPLGGGPAMPWKTTWSLFWGQTTLNPDTVCMTCGIDQIPLSNKIMKDVEDIDPDSYVALLSNNNWLNPVPSKGRNLQSAFHIAKVSTMCKVMGFEDNWADEIGKIDKLKLYLEWASQKRSVKWGTDETYSTLKLQEFVKNGGVVETPLGLDKFLLSRVSTREGLLGTYDVDKVKNGQYYEAACCRPYPKHKDYIQKLLALSPNHI